MKESFNIESDISKRVDRSNNIAIAEAIVGRYTSPASPEVNSTKKINNTENPELAKLREVLQKNEDLNNDVIEPVESETSIEVPVSEEVINDRISFSDVKKPSEAEVVPEAENPKSFIKKSTVWSSEPTNDKYADWPGKSFEPSAKAVQKQYDAIAQKERIIEVKQQGIIDKEVKQKTGFLSRYFSNNKRNASNLSGAEQLTKAENSRSFLARLFGFGKKIKNEGDLEKIKQFQENSNEDIEDSITQVILDTLNANQSKSFGERTVEMEKSLDLLFKRDSIGAKKGVEMYKYIIDNLDGILESREKDPARNRNLLVEDFVRKYAENKKKEFNLV